MSDDQSLRDAQAAVQKAKNGVLGAGVILGFIFLIFLWTLLAGGFSDTKSDKNAASTSNSTGPN